MEPYAYTIHQALEQLSSGALTAEELTASVLDRIEAVEEKVRAYITLDREGAMAQAREADRLIRRGERLPLLGIPLALKDVLCTKGMRTTAGSRILEPFVPPYDATVVERLKKAGAVILGKLTMDEFAMGSTNETCAFGVPRNPWDLSRICGGSSGGSAAAVAADQCLASLGSDTGGSIRQPASHCGVVGLKPTYGRVSRYGLLAYASSLDQVGPLTKDVRDAALLLAVIAGHDPRDSTSVVHEVPDPATALDGDLEGVTVGIPREYFGEGLDPEVRENVEQGIAALAAAGAKTREVSLPHTGYGVAAYYIIAPAEASSNLARYDGVRFGYRDPDKDELIEMYMASRAKGFGTEVKRRILIGTFALSSGYYDAYYKKASQVRTLIVEDYRQAFTECDLIASPVSPTPAWPLGEKGDDPLALYLSDVLTIPANLAGVPALSVPCGLSAQGLPIGLQLQAPHFAEGLLLKAGLQVERRAGMAGSKPPLTP